MGHKTLNQSSKLSRAERKNKALDLRRKGWSIERIGERLDVSHQTIRRDLNHYLSALDEANKQSAAALRAEQYQRLEKYAELVDQYILEDEDLDRIPVAIKLSEQQRKIYAIDVPSTKRTEITYKKQVISELIVTLKTQISPHSYAEVITALSQSDDYQLMGQLAQIGSEEGIEPSAELLGGFTNKKSS